MAFSQRCLFFFVLACFPVLSTAQQRLGDQQVSSQGNTTTSVTGSFTGHYEDTATNKAQKAIPMAIDLTDASGAFSGNISTTLGVFPIVGGTRQANTITINFDASGERGSVLRKLSDGRFLGTFSLGDDGGPVDAKKTSEVPRSATAGKSSMATPILFLDIYHMHNPGLDAVNTQADDVRAPKRQEEIEELLERLARYRPTKMISMDGTGRWIDNVFIERLWRTVKYENIYLHAYRDGAEARQQLSSFFAFYNGRRLHQRSTTARQTKCISPLAVVRWLQQPEGIRRSRRAFREAYTADA
jgi:hypothetical protein